MRQILSAIALLTAVTLPTSLSAQTSPFGVAAVNNAALSETSGGWSSVGYARNARLAINENARAVFQGTALINRVTFDNWFAREGVDLLAATAYGRPLN